MKTGFVAIVVFVAAFIITTAALIYFNTQYMNIFKFNFTPVSHIVVAADSTAKKQVADSSKIKPDSTKALDSLKTIAGGLAPKTDSLKTPGKAENNTAGSLKTGAETKNQNASVPPVINPVAENKAISDSKILETKKMDAKAYDDWKKKTAGIIESMDSYKAAQILRMYADNIGGDILYSMKKKKAAEILSKFDAKKDSLLIRKLTRIK